MAVLSFDEFARILYPYCGNGKPKYLYIKTLTNKIMKGQPGRKIGKTEENGDQNKDPKKQKHQNPIQGKARRTLETYYKGKRRISKRDASIIFSSIDTYKFEQYLKSQCSDTVRELLKADLEKALNQEINDKNRDIIEICADLFAEILHDLASG